MIKLVHTKGLYLDNARYYLDDGNGSKVRVDVDYQGNSFKTKKVDGGNIGYRKLRNEANEFAKKLLAKKSQKNLLFRYK